AAARMALLERGILVLVVVGLLSGVLVIVKPFTTAILFGATLATAAWPARQALVRNGLRRGSAAALLLLLSLVLVVLPMLVVAPHLADQMVQGAERIQSYFAATPEQPGWMKDLPLFGRRRHRRHSSRPSGSGAGCCRCPRSRNAGFRRPAASDQPNRRPAARRDLGRSGLVALRARSCCLGRIYDRLGDPREHDRQFHQ